MLLEVVAMKITNNPPAGKPLASSGATRSGSTGRQTAAAGSGSASATDPAARLSQLEAQYAPSDFSAAKVNEISSAIASGRYQVNAGAVADKLLASTEALGRKSASN
jgi:negative regulator of flagellin synthesis FlgM